jgi:hypothetical protein
LCLTDGFSNADRGLEDLDLPGTFTTLNHFIVGMAVIWLVDDGDPMEGDTAGPMAPTVPEQKDE